ncbi:partial Phosphoenolpyruvate synthase, partial [Anaerolineae bacterium]
MTFILPLDRITSQDAPRVGGKALHLGELIQAGVRVPPGFVITTDAYHAFIASNGLHREIESLLARLHWDSPELKSEIAELQMCVRAQLIPDEIQNAIADA